MNGTVLLFRILLGLPKSIYLNFRCLPIKTAIHLPILVSCHTKLKGIKKGSVVVGNCLRPGQIKIGIIDGSEGIITNRICFLGTSGHGTIRFEGNCNVSPGGTLKAVGDANLAIADGVSFNSGCRVLCKYDISIGKNALFGWECTVSDGDGHLIRSLETNEIINKPMAIKIGSDVWIGANSTLLKGSSIPDGSIVGYGSIVTKSFEENNCVIVGNPARIVKHRISWSR